MALLRKNVASFQSAGVQYLLRGFAQSTCVSRAITDLQNIKQNSGDDRQEYSNRIDHETSRYGSVHEPQDVVTMYISGLDSTIRTSRRCFGQASLVVRNDRAGMDAKRPKQ